jgi:hypothetical protein
MNFAKVQKITKKLHKTRNKNIKNTKKKSM